MGAETAFWKADGNHTVGTVARRPDFPGRRTAAYNAFRRKRSAQRLTQLAQPFVGGAKDKYKPRRDGVQACQKPIRQIGGFTAGLHGHRSGDVLLRSRAGIHQQASNSLIELASKTA